jgi:NodT family efflux transporter outer membrane factor (OMF) lipoprotein
MVTSRHPKKRPHSRWLSALGFAALLASGCTTFEQYIHNGFKVGPEYGRPAAAVAPDWIDAADQRVRKDSDDLSQWWTVFNDPTLDALICDAYRQNLSLRQAGFQVLLARAQLGSAIGGIFPQTQVMTGDYLREGLSVATVNRTAAGTARRFFGQWDYGFNLAWELDFWGRFRRTIESAGDNLDASVENYDDVLVTLLGDVASNYVTIRTLEERIKLAKANVDLQRRTLEIAEARFRGGTGTELDVDQAQSNLSQTESEIPQLEVQLRQASNQLSILLGIPPEDLLKRLAPAGIPAAPPDVAVGIPADLLRRRPDVRRAERLAAAQSALIGVAESDFYPHISIDGSFGYSAEHLNNLFTSRAFNGTFGPAFNWKILNYGRLLNNVRAQDAQFQSLVTAYQNSVLTAGAEVENGLVFFLKAHVRVKALSESVRAAQKAANIALVQYRNGVVDFNRVALLQQNLVQQQDLLAQATGDIALGLIQVYKALGGGWQIRCNGCSSELPAVTVQPATPSPAPVAPELKPPQPPK